MAPAIESNEYLLAPRVAGLASGIQYIDYLDESIPTDELPNMESSREQDELLALEGCRSPFCPSVVPPQVDLKPTQPGWVHTRVGLHTQFPPGPPREGLVFYACYGSHYISIDCSLPGRESSTIRNNYG